MKVGFITATLVAGFGGAMLGFIFNLFHVEPFFATVGLIAWGIIVAAHMVKNA